jgi:hypothetical protein
VAEAPSESAVHACAGDDEWCVVTIRDAADTAIIADVTGGRPLGDWLAGQSARTAMETLQAAGIAAGAMLRVSELPTFDYYVERGFFRTAKHPHMSEVLTVERAPIRAAALPDPLEIPAPLLGEHTTELMIERLGLDREAVAALIEGGALEQFKMPEEMTQ